MTVENVVNMLRDNDMASLKDLLDNRYNPNTRNQYDVPLLHIACEFKNFDAIKLLIKKGADVNGTNPKYQNTALHNSINRMCDSPQLPDIIQLLLEHGAKLNIEDSYGNTPAFVAIDSNAISALKVLLNHPRQDQYAVNGEGLSLLQYAFKRNRQDVVVCIYEHIIAGYERREQSSKEAIKGLTKELNFLTGCRT